MSEAGMIHIVDDDEAVRVSLTFSLGAVGYRVAGYGAADDFLARGRGEPGVLVCDVRMPGMNGIELTQFLRQGGSTMPIILITGNASNTLRAEATSVGADAMLEKPLSLAALRTEITRLAGDG